MADTAYSLEKTAESLSTLATAFGSQAESVGAIITPAGVSIEDAASHWGGPAAQEVLGAAGDYIELVCPKSSTRSSRLNTRCPAGRHRPPTTRRGWRQRVDARCDRRRHRARDRVTGTRR